MLPDICRFFAPATAFLLAAVLGKQEEHKTHVNYRMQSYIPLTLNDIITKFLTVFFVYLFFYCFSINSHISPVD